MICKVTSVCSNDDIVQVETPGFNCIDNFVHSFLFLLMDACLQLFEMGLELSLARLKALAKFAFGMGLTQVYL